MTLDHCSADDRALLLEILEQVGRQLRRQPTILEQLVGLIQQKTAAEARGDQERAKLLGAETENLRALSRGAEPIPALPIAGWRKEWVERTFTDERAWLQELAGL